MFFFLQRKDTNPFKPSELQSRRPLSESKERFKVKNEERWHEHEKEIIKVTRNKTKRKWKQNSGRNERERKNNQA